MEGTFFIFSNTKHSERENIIYIGENGDYKTLEAYLRLARDEFVYDFTKNHLSKQYFLDEDCFISYVHENSLQLRLQEPLIPRKCVVACGEDIDLEDALINKFQFEEEDYDIFSGDMIPLEKGYKETIYFCMQDLILALYQMLDAGYLELENNIKIRDWIILFQEPILDIFIRYHRIDTSAPDISTTDEFLINPEFRKTICLMLMKVISNFIVTNGLVDESILEEFNSWENKDLWYSIQENLENEF